MRIIATTALALWVLAAGAQEVHELPPVRYIDGAPACPSDTDIRNIDTRLSSRVLRPSNERSLRVERRIAVRCRTHGLRYTPADWERIARVVRGEI